MNTLFRKISLFALAIVALSFAPGKATAGFDVIAQTFTMDSATSSVSTTITMKKSKIVDVILYCPTLDSGDTGSLTLAVPLDGVSYTPRGWSAHSIGATEDAAIVKGNSSALDIIVSGDVTVTVTTSTNQGAARTFIVYLLREY